MAAKKRKTISDILRTQDVISGMKNLLVKETINSRTFRADNIIGKANYQTLEIFDDWLVNLLKSWYFNDRTWRNEVCTAVNEWLTNMVQRHPPGSKGGTKYEMHLQCLTFLGKRHRYFYALISSNKKEDIDVKNLKVDIPSMSDEGGRGTIIIVSFSDLFTIVKNLGFVIIAKKMRRVKSSKKV